jgi:hypothetical protein
VCRNTACFKALLRAASFDGSFDDPLDNGMWTSLQMKETGNRRKRILYRLTLPTARQKRHFTLQTQAAWVGARARVNWNRAAKHFKLPVFRTQTSLT